MNERYKDTIKTLAEKANDEELRLLYRVFQDNQHMAQNEGDNQKTISASQAMFLIRKRLEEQDDRRVVQ